MSDENDTSINLSCYFELIFSVQKLRNRYFSNHIFKKKLINITVSTLINLDTADSLEHYMQSYIEIEYDLIIKKITNKYIKNNYKNVIIKILEFDVI